MSKIYEKESQLIVRFPKDVAAKLRAYFEQSKKNVLEAHMNSEQTRTNGAQAASGTAPTAAGVATAIPQGLPILPALSNDESIPQLSHMQSEINPAAINSSIAASSQAPNISSTSSDKGIPQVSMQPRVIIDEETGVSRVTFDVVVDDFKSKGSLIDLACMLETYKTKDTINIFKSNDTRQMIYVHAMDEEEVPKSLATKKVVTQHVEVKKEGEKQEPQAQDAPKETMEFKYVKFESHHGLTPPTHFIRKRFYRKKPILSQDEVQDVEKIMVKIQKEIAKNDKEPERQKRKYKKRY